MFYIQVGPNGEQSDEETNKTPHARKGEMLSLVTLKTAFYLNSNLYQPFAL